MAKLEEVQELALKVIYTKFDSCEQKLEKSGILYPLDYCEQLCVEYFTKVAIDSNH